MTSGGSSWPSQQRYDSNNSRVGQSPSSDLRQPAVAELTCSRMRAVTASWCPSSCPGEGVSVEDRE